MVVNTQCKGLLFMEKYGENLSKTPFPGCLDLRITGFGGYLTS